ncbi:MAG: hypothetical protein JEY79_07120 [Pseudodesulfovibrio sp.]|nr:hypothetical protein [Pseudodesulfovibrio sp.]
MTRLFLTTCIAMIATLCLATVSSAHKVNIFAYVDGNTVVTDSGYSRTKRVQDGIVEVYDVASGTLLLSGNTDTGGNFVFEIPDEAQDGRMDLRLLLKAGAGHQAEWVVKYAEYGGKEASSSLKSNQSEVVVISADADKQIVSTPVETAAIEAIVRRELAPVKSMLADLSQSGPGVTEIIGGIGYIFGLFGIVAYMKSRNNNG